MGISWDGWGWLEMAGDGRGWSEMTGDDRDWPGIAGDGQGRHGQLQGHPRRLVGVRDYKRFAIFCIKITQFAKKQTKNDLLSHGHTGRGRHLRQNFPTLAAPMFSDAQ